MVGTLVAMAPLAALGGVAIGWTALVHIGIAVGTALALHGAFNLGEQHVAGRVLHPSVASSLVAGAIVGLSMIATAPYAITAGVAALATLLKFAQGWGPGGSTSIPRPRPRCSSLASYPWWGCSRTRCGWG